MENPPHPTDGSVQSGHETKQWMYTGDMHLWTAAVYVREVSLQQRACNIFTHLQDEARGIPGQVAVLLDVRGDARGSLAWASHTFWEQRGGEVSADVRGYAGGSLAWTMHIGSRGEGRCERMDAVPRRHSNKD